MREPLPNLRIITNLLLILEVVLGVVIISVTAFYQTILGSFMVALDRKMLTAKFFSSYIFAFQLIASYLCSISMWRQVWPRRFTETLHILLSIWLFFCFLIVLCGLASIWFLFSSSDALESSAEMMLYKGIDFYYMKPEWKLLWDQLQYTEECCGVHSYRDWMLASWAPKTVEDCHVNRGKYRESRDTDNSENDYDCMETTERTTTRLLTMTDTTPSQLNMEGMRGHTLAPYACCKHDSINCYQNYLPSTTIPHLNLSDINLSGCLPKFSKYVNAMMYLLMGLTLAAIILDLIICCITKYVMFKNKHDCNSRIDRHPLFDDEGNALVVIKCPPNVKCISLEEQQHVYDSENNSIADVDPCLLYCEDDDRYKGGQEINQSKLSSDDDVD